LDLLVLKFYSYEGKELKELDLRVYDEEMEG
jgi:hypothetical protein